MSASLARSSVPSRVRGAASSSRGLKPAAPPWAFSAGASGKPRLPLAEQRGVGAPGTLRARHRGPCLGSLRPRPVCKRGRRSV